ncbi:hypothetical protein DH2020_026556 [Rehmannia glutinosa]|uniref:Reverse transcriptase zinc-binding domain-containing protein n=1 Tax=Rehmannia glutinosa TaxID=99300 RepID=A0ABR0VXI8_REHGL
MVKDLLSPSLKEWNVELIKRTFCKEEADLILGIPLPRCYQDDQLICHFSQNGKYSVKTGYHLARRHYYLKNEASRGGGGSGSKSKSPRLFIWSPKVPEKIKITVWRLATNSLPTRQNLVRKKIITDIFCPLCEQGAESAVHRVIECDFARQCWALSNIPFSTWQHVDGEVESWLRTFQQNLDHNQWRLAMIIIWSMWQQRNIKNIGETCSNPYEVIQFSISYLQAIDLHCLNCTPPLQQPGEQEWQPPPIDTVKINFDASFSTATSSWGLGFIARDHNGLSLGWRHKEIHGIFHPTTAEAMAAREAVYFANEKGWRNVVVELKEIALLS